MDENDTQTQTASTEEGQNLEQNDSSLSDEDIQDLPEEAQKRIKTLDAQRKRYREQAIDPETGKKYKDLVDELKSDKTEQKNDGSSQKSEDDFGLEHQAFLRSAGLKDNDEIELAKKVQQETGMEWTQLVDSDYFTYRLNQHREDKQSQEATDTSGGKGTGEAKTDPNYWVQLGRPPTADEVPNRKDRTKIHRTFMENEGKGGKKFYND